MRCLQDSWSLSLLWSPHRDDPEPNPRQPDGNEYLLVSYPYALWVDGDRIHIVASKQLINPP